jgi:hypothetical protein
MSAVRAWIIENIDEPDLAWSNAFGWCTDCFDTFSHDEREALRLPIGGRWVAVPWQLEEAAPCFS